ncbi:uncharacterized protein LOC130502383 [Raphanus sativus]|uniref:Uncharacterized protein LOC130502383 n=1 Tax=Raphanus sativus TaxID=3726 RepID=A0A9W3CNF2_RAPSA|nr:uncharacterized protein LOC130502383 [Raphanus sativus]
MSRVQRNIPIGKWVVIEKVHMTTAGGQYKTTHHPYKMNISDETVVRGSDLSDDRIFLNLSDYSQIGNDPKELSFLIDVMGKIHDLGDVLTVRAQGEDRKRVQFRLMDTRGNSLVCCLWGTYAEQIEAFRDEHQDRSIVALIRFAKINFFRGEVQITNAFGASLLYLNPTLPEVLELSERLSDDQLQLALPDNGKKDGKRIKYDWNDAEVKPISEVLSANQVEICKIICSVEAIDTDWTWFYFGCNRHQKRANKLPKIDYENLRRGDKPMFHCELCNANITNVLPKFKLHLVVKDNTDTCNVMLLGSVAKSIIGHKAEDLWDGSYAEIEDPEILPAPIQDLVGKSFCFGLSITSDNVTNGSGNYIVLEVCSGDKVLSIETVSEAISDIGTTSSTMSSAPCMLLDTNSSEDPKTPFSKRKDEKDDLPDITSSSKKMCTKLIKEEKHKSD